MDSVFDTTLAGPLMVRSPNWLGDAVMALPAVRNLKTMMVRDKLVVATPEKLAALWLACPFVDRVLVLPQPRNILTTFDQIRADEFATAVLLPNSLRSAAEVFLAGVPTRIGYARGGRGLLLTRTVPVPERNPLRLHQRYYYLDLVHALGGPTDDSVPELRDVIRSEKPHEGLQIAICPGAEYGPAKRWPSDRFLAVARHFVDKQQARIVLLGAPGDAALAEEMALQLPGAENHAGKTSLAEFMTVLADSQLVICNDSGSMHLASVMGRPTVAIFGSTEPLLTGPMGPHTRILRHHVPCSPCFLRECPIDFGCMRGVSPGMVIAEAEQLLEPAR